MGTVHEALEQGGARYRGLAVFRAVAEDRVPKADFPRFFVEQAMAARWFQDFIWAGTEISEGPLAEFAKGHRRKDSGHYRWAEGDLERFGLGRLDLDAAFSLDRLATRIQLARILAQFHGADDGRRLAILLALEQAGDITLSTLNGYVHRHGLAELAHYLGDGHVAVEERQAEAIAGVLGGLLSSSDPALVAAVETTYDALCAMFSAGGERHWGPWLPGAQA